MGCPHPNYLGLWASELVDWEAFYEMEPFGEKWKQTAMQLAVGASNGFFNGKHKWEKFMPVRPEVVRQSQSQIARGLKGTFDSLKKQSIKKTPKNKKRRNG